MNYSQIDKIAGVIADTMINVDEISIMDNILVITFYNKYWVMEAMSEPIPETVGQEWGKVILSNLFDKTIKSYTTRVQ